MKILNALLLICLILFCGCRKETLQSGNESQFNIIVDRHLFQGFPRLDAVIVSDSDGNNYYELLIKSEIMRQSGYQINTSVREDDLVHVSFIAVNPNSNTLVASTFFDVKSGAKFEGKTILSRPEKNIDVRIIGIPEPNALQMKMGSNVKKISYNRQEDSIRRIEIPMYLDEEPVLKFWFQDSTSYYTIPEIPDEGVVIISKDDFIEIDNEVVLDTTSNTPGRLFNDRTPRTHFIGKDNLTGKTYPMIVNWNYDENSFSLFTIPGLDLIDKKVVVDHNGVFKVRDFDEWKVDRSFLCETSRPSEISPPFEPNLSFSFTDTRNFAEVDYFKMTKRRTNPFSFEIIDTWSLQGKYIPNFHVVMPKISDELLELVYQVDNVSNESSQFYNINQITEWIKFDEFDSISINQNPLIVNDFDWILNQNMELCRF